MKISARFQRVVGLSVLLTGIATAQESDLPPAQAGAYDLQGSFLVGYRYVNVSPGDKTGPWFEQNAANLYHEQFSRVRSDSSPTIPQMVPLQVNLYGERRGNEAGFFDQIYLNGQMNPTVSGASLRLRKFDGYEFNLGYQRVNFFMDRYDSLFTDLRRYDTHRNTLNASLAVALMEGLGATVSYRGIGHGGTVDLPRPMFVEGAPEGFLGTGRDRVLFTDFRNNYLMQMPRADYNSTMTAALNGTFGVVDVSVGAGYTSFTDDYQVTPLFGTDSLQINFRDTNNKPNGMVNSRGVVGDVTARERLFRYSHTEDREASGPFFFGQVVARPVDMISLTADFRMDQLDMKNTVVTDQEAEFRRTSAARAFQRYGSHYIGHIENDLERMRFAIMATLSPMPELDVTLGYKLDNSDIHSKGDYDLHFDTTASSTSSEFRTILTDSVKKMDWHQGTYVPKQTILGTIILTPMRDFVFNVTGSLAMRKPNVYRKEEHDFDSVATTNLSKERTDLGIAAGFAYRLTPELRVRARYELTTRKAEFGEDSLSNGPAVGTAADLEPRNLPETMSRIDASVDWRPMPELSAAFRFKLFDGSSDLNESMYVMDGPTEKVELVNKGTNVSAAFTYRPNRQTTLRLLGETRTNDYSIPVTWTRGAILPAPIFVLDPTAPPRGAYNAADSASVLVMQETNDVYLDFAAETKLIDALTIGAGISYLNVTGSPTITPEVKPNANGTLAGATGEGDVTRSGGPFNRIIVNGNLGYDITRQFGVGIGLQYAMQNEEELMDIQKGMRFYGFNDYKGLSATFNIFYNL